MKILAISNYYPPLFEGGYELSIAENMRHLEKRGHEIHVLCGMNDAFGSVLLANNSDSRIQRKLPLLTNWDKPNARNANRGLKASNFKITKKFIAQLAPDIIYLGNQKLLTIGPALAAQKSGIPLIYDMGDDWLRLYTPRTLKQHLSALIGIGHLGGMHAKLRLNPVISPSQWFATELKRRYQVARSYVIPRLIDIPACQSPATSLPLKFVFAGRIEPLKGLQHIIQIAPRLIAHQPDFQLDIFGDDSEPYAEMLKQELEQKGICKHFCFKGKSKDISAELCHYDVLIMPTLATETFGRIIIEAMAAGLIVIASDQYGPAEIIDSPQDSLLFERDNPESLLEAILSLYRLEPKDLDIIKQRAFQKARTQYSPELHIPRLEEILTQEINLQNANIRGLK